jgi:farnesyl-diphosphate farnesyltransferase
MADLDQLLEKTSRTFALSIPLLPEPTRREVTLAYLLFRIADTFEDAALWGKKRRIRALEDFGRLLDEPSEARARELSQAWLTDLPLTHEGYLELLEETPFVIGEYALLSPAARELIKVHTQRTCHGMAGFVDRADEDGELKLASLDDLRDYCYVVAGIVGEMLTELYLLGTPELQAVAEELRPRARDFGEGLQLVNILKDSAFDKTEGRRYLPPGVERADVFALARRDLETATEYTLAIQRAGAPRGVIAFNALPVQLAWATLDKVETEGPGSKITRPEVYRIVEGLEHALDTGRPAVDPPAAA